jgi:DNA-binding NarL/FixJ family response regulator
VGDLRASSAPFRAAAPVARSASADLTRRESEVFDLIRRGLTTAEIADRCYVAPVTIRTHVSSILKKLGAPDRRAAVRIFEQTGSPVMSSASAGSLGFEV